MLFKHSVDSKFVHFALWFRTNVSIDTILSSISYHFALIWVQSCVFVDLSKRICKDCIKCTFFLSYWKVHTPLFWDSFFHPTCTIFFCASRCSFICIPLFSMSRRWYAKLFWLPDFRFPRKTCTQQPLKHISSTLVSNPGSYHPNLILFKLIPPQLSN